MLVLFVITVENVICFCAVLWRMFFCRQQVKATHKHKYKAFHEK